MSHSKCSVFTYDNFVHAFGGAAGSIFTMLCFYPLEILKFRMQLGDAELLNKSTTIALLHILKTEGVEALYRGVTPCLSSLAISNFVFFYSFHSLKSLKIGTLNNTAKLDMMLSFLAGFVNICLTTPLWVVNYRLKIGKQQCFTGLLDGMLYIATREGIGALWTGFIPSLMLLANPVIHFTVYEYLKRCIQVKSSWSYFYMGAISKTIATLLTYPLQLVQTKQRIEKNFSPGTLALILAIVKKDGPGALFCGLESKLLQTVLMAAMTFMTYEKIIVLVFRILKANEFRKL
ncbi:hypothetical protein WA026_022820 [Henosepilachna vigintioctopunctata]|uniref:Peroxisomal membrane protein PMP34 n=1 Tax=Henosepilachna vigintioctopunctata TaxID=420089 RepID=A0AAW1VJL2_9CUCU